jgi:hypothetical protein
MSIEAQQRAASMSDDLDPRTHTWAYGEPMRIEDRGIVEYDWVDAEGKPRVLRFSVGRLAPLTEGEG